MVYSVYHMTLYDLKILEGSFRVKQWFYLPSLVGHLLSEFHYITLY